MRTLHTLHSVFQQGIFAVLRAHDEPVIGQPPQEPRCGRVVDAQGCGDLTGAPMPAMLAQILDEPAALWCLSQLLWRSRREPIAERIRAEVERELLRFDIVAGDDLARVMRRL